MKSDSQKLWIALVVMLLASIGLSLPYPVLTPLFINTDPNALNSWLGFSPEFLFTLLIAIYPLGIFVGSSFIGALSDRFGRKKVLSITLITCFFGYIVSAYALHENDYLLLLLSRLFTGLTEGNVAIARAIALDIGSDNSEQESGHGISKIRAVSLINSSMFLGWLLGPLLGGILANYQPFYAMLAAALGALVALVLVFAWLQETVSLPLNNKSFWQVVKSENSLLLIKDKWLRQIFYMYLMYSLALNLFYEFYPVWLVDVQNFGSLGIGLATTNMTIFMTLTSIFLVTKVQSRYGATHPMAIIMLLMSLLLLAVPFSFSWTTQVLFAISGILIATINGLMPVYVSDSQPEKGNGAVMGLLTITFCIANVIAALIGGLLLKLSSDFPLFISSALFLFATAMFHHWFIQKRAVLS